jgi:hypothetical protein
MRPRSDPSDQWRVGVTFTPTHGAGIVAGWSVTAATLRVCRAPSNASVTVSSPTVGPVSFVLCPRCVGCHGGPLWTWCVMVTGDGHRLMPSVPCKDAKRDGGRGHCVRVDGLMQMRTGPDPYGRGFRQAQGLTVWGDVCEVGCGRGPLVRKYIGRQAIHLSIEEG